MLLKKIIAGAMAVVLIEAGAYANCTVNATGVNFGDYLMQNASPTDGAGSLTIECRNNEANVQVALSTGQSGTYSGRIMRGGAENMRYNLFTNVARTTIWGDNSAGTTQVNLTKVKNPITIPIYGRIPIGQNLSTGIYNDPIFVTITF